MTKWGHRATGLGAALLAGGLAVRLDGSPLFAALMALPGATAPDWLEGRRWVNNTRVSIIKHRTITHWVPLWLMLTGAAAYALLHPQVWPITELQASLALGFGLGGLMHLLVDLPNPMGIPFLTPRRRWSLNWWKSGQYELILVAAIDGACYGAHRLLIA